MLEGLTTKNRVTDYVLAYVQQQERDALRKKVAALQAWKPLFLAVPPGQATGHRISAPGPVKKTDAPLSGATLLDGRAAAWEVRLREKSSSYHNGDSRPLILNYYEARQIRAEYASLEFKLVPPERGADFPNAIEEQQKLVGELYDAILNMDDILEKKRPISLKKMSSNDHNPPDTSTRKRTAAVVDDEADEKDDGKEEHVDDDDNGDEDCSGNETSLKASDRDKHNDNKEANGGTTPHMSSDKVDPVSSPLPKPKETISVVKVKSLSRIEVEMLCWEILVWPLLSSLKTYISLENPPKN